MAYSMTRLRQWLAEIHATLRAVLVDSSKQLIMWLLLLLVAIFIAGMWILSSLNLGYSQQAMGELRQKQIEDTFLASLNKITARQNILEHYTTDLARLGELFYEIDASGADGVRAQLDSTLKQKLEDFHGASGIGIWFEPGRLATAGKSLYAYAYRNSSGRIQLQSGRMPRGESYRQQQWYPLALPADGNSPSRSEENIYWTAAYFNERTDSAVLTLVSPMFAADGALLGYVTTDWESSQIIDLVSQVDITPNTFAFLIDSSNRKLSSLSKLEDELHAQRLIDAVVAQKLISVFEPGQISLLTRQQQRALMQNRTLQADNREYALYYAGTPAGMLFGVGVPRDEIEAVMAPMRQSNDRILLLTGLVMLLLSGYLVYRIAELMHELQASYTDQLTGLPNRARLLLDLDRSVNGVLILINLDRFKEINSLFGHGCGDEVLQALSRNISQFIDEHAQFAFARLYRLTADEFVIFGSGVSADELKDFVAALSELLQDLRVVWQQQDISLAATLGVASCEGKAGSNGCSPDALISQATVALRQARELSRNYQFYDTEQGVERGYEQNLVWAGRLKEALQQDRILPWFQPIYDNRTGKIAKYECLVRMIGEDGGVISPGLFLGVAGKLRLDHFLTRIMVDKSFKTFIKLPYEFSINLSYRDLLDTELTAFIIDRLKLTGIGPRLIFEILESDGIENYHEVRQFIDEVKTYGCKIAIDDFGSGYSNFEHLLRLNVDLIKIDGSLIKNLHHDQNALTVTRGVVQFARSLGIETVAEFVHCVEVQEQVAELGIDFSQGAYISMPQPELVQDVALTGT